MNTVIQINKLLRHGIQYGTKTLKIPPSFYVKAFFSLTLSIHILLFINEILHVTVKYNVRDKIYRVNLTKK